MKITFSKEEFEKLKNGNITINDLAFLVKLSVLRSILLDCKKQNKSFIFKQRRQKK